MMNSDKIKELFTYQAPQTERRKESHQKVQELSVNFALGMGEIIDNPAELTVILRKIQEIRMLANQAVCFKETGMSYKQIFED